MIVESLYLLLRVTGSSLERSQPYWRRGHFRRATRRAEAVAARDQNAWWCCKRNVITTSGGLRPPDPPHETFTNTVPLMTLDNLPIKSGRRLYFLKVCFN